MKSRWIYVLTVLLVAANIALLAQVRHLRGSAYAVIAPPEVYVNSDRLPEVTVLSRMGKQAPLLELVSGNEHTLIVLFSPSDCPPCFSESEVWEAVPDRASISVYGVGMHVNADEFFQWVDNSGFGMDTYLDTSGMLAQMGWRVSPLKVLVDSTGRILWADPPREPGPARVRFWRDLSYAIDHM